MIEKRNEIVYAAGYEEKPGSFGMYDGPTLSLHQILESIPNGPNPCIIRFNLDGSEQVLYRWDDNDRSWKLQIIEELHDVLRTAIDKERTPFALLIEADIIANPPQVERHTCHDCGAIEGAVHQYGCDMERCPFCGNQLISCGCCYDLLGIEHGEGTWAYSNGLTAEQETQWQKMLTEKGRVPYIVFPNICRRCGQLWPVMFGVPAADWEKYVPIRHRREMLCLDCYKAIKFMIDSAKAQS